MKSKKWAAEVVERLKAVYPEAVCALHWGNEGWKLLIMGRLSAQCTDARVNVVVQDLYEKFPTMEALAAADVDEIEKIAEVPGVDILFIGPADLSQSLGCPGDLKNPLIRNAISRAVKAAEANGKWCGTSGLDPEYTQNLLEQGVRFVTLGSDYGMIRNGVRNVLAQYNSIAEKLKK